VWKSRFLLSISDRRHKWDFRICGEDATQDVLLLYWQYYQEKPSGSMLSADDIMFTKKEIVRAYVFWFNGTAADI